MAVIEPSDWPEDPNPLTPEEFGGYKEFVDKMPDSDARQKLIHEATAHAQQAVWTVRQRDFFKWLASKERVWFG